MILGVGVGSLEPEFELVGAAFADRGARGDDALRALRVSFGRQLPEYHGEFYDYEGLLVDPCGVQQTVPLWIGGRTPRSLRRAVELADGWVPFGLSTAEQAEMLDPGARHRGVGPSPDRRPTCRGSRSYGLGHPLDPVAEPTG